MNAPNDMQYHTEKSALACSMEEVSTYTITQKGDVLQCQNNRMLALIPYASKLLVCIIIDRIQHLSRKVSDMHASFRHR